MKYIRLFENEMPVRHIFLHTFDINKTKDLKKYIDFLNANDIQYDLFYFKGDCEQQHVHNIQLRSSPSNIEEYRILNTMIFNVLTQSEMKDVMTMTKINNDLDLDVFINSIKYNL